ncbi:hypothetical protein RQP54_16660 [Curvibacter sp. APW13]|uniref:hypothetical protein n=1 Tax=Curvibacter sp. APW13 TaxID=3077236 RepID=UPI0028DEFAF8|nr:hypothetical protein [Curvibacter sp. APW13]MDT8992504.1 hypothetical protein [Curvibacter sp. APW13]
MATVQRRRRQLTAAAAVVVAAVLGWWLWPTPDASVEAAAVVPNVGSEGTVFGPLRAASAPGVQPSTAAQAPAPGGTLDEETLRLWPHLRQPAPTREEQAAIQAQWSRFAQQHPDNLYLPASMQPALTSEQARAARQRLDNTTAVEARQAAQSYALRYAEPGQPPPSAPAAPADAAMQRDYFDYKIRELESRLQLVHFYLANGQPSAQKRAAANKDIQQWTRELESLRQGRAMLPSS